MIPPDQDTGKAEHFAAAYRSSAPGCPTGAGSTAGLKMMRSSANKPSRY